MKVNILKNRNKYIIIILILIILVIITGLLLQNKKNYSDEYSSKAVSIENKSRIINTIAKQYLIDENKPNFSPSLLSKSSVPWQELDQQWFDEVKNLLMDLDPDEGEKIFNSYLEERFLYREKDRVLQIQYQNLYNMKPIDKNLQKKLENQSSLMVNETTEKTKSILGKYYKNILNLNREFTDKIQVYSRDMPISVDSGFY